MANPGKHASHMGFDGRTRSSEEIANLLGTSNDRKRQHGETPGGDPVNSSSTAYSPRTDMATIYGTDGSRANLSVAELLVLAGNIVAGFGGKVVSATMDGASSA